MSIKAAFASFLGKSSYWFLHNFRSGGSSYPGKLATRIDPEILRHLAENYDVIIVTGTNGKTMTTSLLTKILKEQYPDVLTNPSGSNMLQGIVTSFLAAGPKPKGRKGLAVLEVDEANVEPVCRQLTPTAFLLTNIFRDQMDRYGEIYTTYQKIVDGIKLAPQATIIANGDAPIFNSKQLPNPIIYYGFADSDKPDADLRASFNSDGVLCPVCNHILHYHSITYANLGDYFCPNCSFSRPELTDAVTAVQELRPTFSNFIINKQAFTIHVGGVYNIYNALAAYTTAKFLKIAPESIAAAFNYDEQVFGRQEVIKLNGKHATIILVKNPVGLNQVFDLIKTDPHPYSLGFLLNAHAADGKDTSWIWDGEFEQLPFQDIPKIILGGERLKDIQLRFKVAGANADSIVATQDLTDFITQAGEVPDEHIYILTTYTAMLALRKQLANQGIIPAGF
ncbi:UDP-N-acetylmuramyl peptide synthase [Lapidilactobacillus concavus]|uniref:Mur ligase family protein n=1 Tax=Lapidilactobacillus concavus TaxID=287844 RepID=UPI00070D994F|nr:Mur ligase family protein [Lapidilactobacillus concavus]GEL13187.1 UDP-N-acetylmuramyl peptide synthase [Lapidilactobacillus concavus]